MPVIAIEAISQTSPQLVVQPEQHYQRSHHVFCQFVFKIEDKKAKLSIKHFIKCQSLSGIEFVLISILELKAKFIQLSRNLRHEYYPPNQTCNVKYYSSIIIRAIK
uniref:Uncharacterized protein n=1 Tax=Glossina palpalis gambiensis TaxID=67801 RepID=A0A1B0AU65_9MUSC